MRGDRLLSAALVALGAGFLLIYPMAAIWPEGWVWHHGTPASDPYFLMIVGVYATLGIFLIRAAPDPAAHGSLIWFTAWSSIVHGLIMAALSWSEPSQRGHLIGDVPATLAAGLVLVILMRRSAKPQ